MRFTPAAATAASGVTVKELADDPPAPKPVLSLNQIYRRLVYDRLKGDKAKITMTTILVMIASEVPIYFFTLLDVLKLESLFKYRLHYIQEHTEHLGIRNYPPLDLILKTAKVCNFNFYFAYIIPAAVMMKLGSKLGIYVYDTEASEEKLTWRRFFKEFFLITFLADLGFYTFHRIMHLPQYYLKLHKKHHDFKYTIAVAHHWMTYMEALIFVLPQALPPLILWPLLGQRMHVMSMWAGVLFAQLSGIFGHAGYRIPGLPRWVPFFQPAYHDYHHVDYSANFGAMYPFTDWIFGTYLHAGLETDMKKVMQNVKPTK